MVLVFVQQSEELFQLFSSATVVQVQVIQVFKLFFFFQCVVIFGPGCAGPLLQYN